MMQVEEISIEAIDVSEYNTRKDLVAGQDDSTIDDLAADIERRGLINPIHVMAGPAGGYSLIAGQRRLLAFKRLDRKTIPAVILHDLRATDAIALSLAENLHRADMHPLDKAGALGALRDELGSIAAVSRTIGLSEKTVRKYLGLLGLAPEIRDSLAAGETRATEALSRLARQVPDPQAQRRVFEEIRGFSQEEQLGVLRELNPDLSNLDETRDRALEGAFAARMIRNCPWDCPTIPEKLKARVAELIEDHRTGAS